MSRACSSCATVTWMVSEPPGTGPAPSALLGVHQRDIDPGEGLTLRPAKLPLFVNALLAFIAVDLPAEGDLAHKLILAEHRQPARQWVFSVP